MKRVISVVLVFAMILSLTPMEAIAAVLEAHNSNESTKGEAGLYQSTGTMVEMVEANAEQLPITSADDFVYTILNGTFCEITGYVGADTEISVPSEIDGYIVQSIGSGAFKGNTALTTVVFSETIETIGSSAFYGCKGLTDVLINHGLTNIEAKAFWQCVSLESITFPSTVQTIGDYAFSGCTGLTYVNLPEGLTGIGNYAFRDCTALVDIRLPDSVTTIGRNAFADCTKLSSINYPLSWAELGSVNGYTGPTNQGHIFDGCTNLKRIEIPEGVTVIPSCAFNDCPYLEEVILPSTLTTIGTYAFQDCTGLKAIELPKSLKAIGSSAFNGCTGLTSVEIPDSVRTISNSVFGDCSGLRSVIVCEGTSAIGDYTFSGCTRLTDVSLPNGLTQIGNYAFRNCTALVDIRLPDSVTTIGRNAFADCTKLSSINYPLSWAELGSVNGYTGPTNQGHIFDGCTNLKRIEIPEGVTVIPSCAFNDCPYLEEVILPSTLTTIGTYAFQDCTGLEKIWIGKNVSAIGTNAFTNCSALTIHGVTGSYAEEYAASKNIPFSTEMLEYTTSTISGFVQDGNGKGVAGITVTLYDLTLNTVQTVIETDETGGWSNSEVFIGHNYELWFYHVDYTIAENAQRYTITKDAITTPDVIVTARECQSETVVEDYTYTVLSGTSCKITGYKGTATAIRLPSEIDGYIVQSIGSGAFKGNTALTTVVFPETIETIGSSAFYGCKGLTDVLINHGLTNIEAKAFWQCVSLESITFPSTVQTIGDYAFSGCTRLTYVNLPEGLTGIGNYAFRDCTALVDIRLPDSVTTIGCNVFEDCTKLSSINYPLHWTEVSKYNGLYGEIFAGCINLKRIEIPEGVTTIPDYAFNKCPYLEEVILPSTLTTIGSYAFSGCTGLKVIKLPESLTAIKGYAFNGCTGLTNIEVPGGIKTITISAFDGCAGLKDVKLPNGLTKIGNYAFRGCTALVGIQLPDSVTTIGYSAFKDCTQLSSINYPMNWKTADSQYNNLGEIFAGCTNLKRIEIPEGVTTIPDYAFNDCPYLEEVILPSTLTSIGSYAFQDCTGLKVIELPESLRTLGSYAFSKCTCLKAIELPESLTTLGSYAFSKCTGLTSVEVPGGVKTITISAFDGCTRLKNVSLSEGLTKIGNYAFRDCTALVSIRLPDSVTTIGYSAFKDCTKLSSINYPMNWKTADSQYNNLGEIFAGCTNLKRIEIPEGVTTIPDYAFSKCSYLAEVILPSTLTTIGAYAFQDCTRMNYLTLPNSLKTVGAYAFRNCIGLRSINMGNGLKTIGKYAFAGCDGLVSLFIADNVVTLSDYAFYDCINLKSIQLPYRLKTIGKAAFKNCVKVSDLAVPNSVTSIADDAFYGLSKLVFYCSSHSYAAVYAIDHDIPIIDTDDNSDSESAYIDRLNSYYKVNGGGISASGHLAMVAKYAFKDNVDASQIKLTFNIPGSVSLDEETLTVDGVLCTDYSYVNGILTVPVTNVRGTVRFLLKPLNYDRITAYCKLSFYDGTANTTEILGTVYTEIPILTISSPEETAKTEFRVSGVTIPNSSVTLFVNGKQHTTTQANNVGDYSATVQLDELSEGKKYTIAAKITDASGSVVTAETTTVYRSAIPVLTEFIMEYGGKTYKLHELAGTKPSVTWASSYEYQFTVRFDNASSVSSVYIVSTRNNVKKYMKAEWNPNQQAFIAEGFFGDDSSYVPGYISVEYARNNGEVSFVNGYDFTSEEALNEIPEKWKDTTFDIVENTEDTTDVLLKIPEGEVNEDYEAIRVVSTKRPLPADLTKERAKEFGYKETTDDTGKAVYTRVYQDPGYFYMDVLDIEASEAFTQIVGLANVANEVVKKDYVLEPLDTIVSGAGFTMDFLDMLQSCVGGVADNMEYGNMKRDILNAPNLNNEQKQVALKNLDEAAIINTMAAVSKIELVLVGALTGTAFAAAFGPAGAILGAAAVSVCLGFVENSFDELQKYTMWRMQSMMHRLLTMGFTWAIDPCGFVYNNETGEYISGATVTAYWLPYDENDPDYWNETPSSDEYGETWDSTAFSQNNPLTTDINGWYAWDVPEGWWRVKCEKEGYETTWSEWLPVPPPQTEVNIGMTPEGGTVTPSVQPTLTLKAPTLEFRDMITVNAFYTAENTEDVVEMGMITYSSKVDTWSVDNAEHIIPGATYDSASGRYYSCSQGIHAKYLGDTVYLAIYAELADGTYAYSKLVSYSAVTYATNQLKNSTDTSLKQLVVAMLNYGAAAQNYFGYNTGVLANASMTAEQLALPEAYRADMISAVGAVDTAKQGIFANNSGFASRKPAISFEGAFCINYFFTPNYAPPNGITLYYWDAADYAANGVLSTANATGKFKLTGSGIGEYRGDIEGIAAKNISNAFYVAAAYKDSNGTVWTSGVLGYSIGAYCGNQASKGGTIADLAMATAVYGHHAKQYFG